MPRTSSERAFGFRAEGLTRVLTGARPPEVIQAINDLGLLITCPTSTSSLRAVLNALGVIQDLLGELESIERALFDTGLALAVFVSDAFPLSGPAVALVLRRLDNQYGDLADLASSGLRVTLARLDKITEENDNAATISFPPTDVI